MNVHALRRAQAELSEIVAEIEVLRAKGKGLNDYIEAAKDEATKQSGEGDISPQPEQDG